MITHEPRIDTIKTFIHFDGRNPNSAYWSELIPDSVRRAAHSWHKCHVTQTLVPVPLFLAFPALTSNLHSDTPGGVGAAIKIRQDKTLKQQLFFFSIQIFLNGGEAI